MDVTAAILKGANAYRRSQLYCTQTKETAMRKSMARIFLVLFLLMGTSALLGACNTTEGAGKDISKAGHAISNEAEEHKP
jgi:entericidin B